MSERSLHRKVSEIVEAVAFVAKDKQNTAQHYGYVSDKALLEAVRGHMAERQLTLVPRVVSESVEVRDRSKGGYVTTATVEYVLSDGESGESIVVSVMGQGFDSLDKGAYKAMTGALKYAIRQIFLIPTGDDAEAPTPADEESDRPTDRQRDTVDRMVKLLSLEGKELDLLYTAHGIQRGTTATRDQVDGLIAELYERADKRASK